MNNLLTTCIFVKNGGEFIGETLDSIAKQTLKPSRLVIIDNGSTDDTKNICFVHQADLPPTTWIQNETDIGHIGSQNRALDLFAAKTSFLHITTCDDVLHPSFYAALIAASTTPGRGLVFSDHTHEQKDLCYYSRFKPRYISLQSFLRRMSELRSVPPPAMLLKTNYLPLQPRMLYPQVGECLFHAQVAMDCNSIVHVPSPLCFNRLHAKSQTWIEAKKLQSWVIDEWLSMTAINNLGGLGKLRLHKLACMFAARSRVKMSMVNPDYAAQIKAATKSRIRWYHWLLGSIAYSLRIK